MGVAQNGPLGLLPLLIHLSTLRSEDGASKIERSDRGTTRVKRSLSSLCNRVSRHKDKVSMARHSWPQSPMIQGRSGCTEHSKSPFCPYRGRAWHI